VKILNIYNYDPSNAKLKIKLNDITYIENLLDFLCIMLRLKNNTFKLMNKNNTILYVITNNEYSIIYEKI
jgi:hypothetical protein